MNKRKQRKAHESESHVKFECTQHLDEREISEREKFKREWLKDYDDLREGLKKIPDLSPQAVNVTDIVIDAQTARAIMDETDVPFSCTPEELAGRLTRALRWWYAVNQQPKASIRKQLRGVIELPNDVPRHPRMLQVVAERMNAFGRKAVRPDKKYDKNTKWHIHRSLDETPEDKRGRPENWALRSLVLWLADIYEEFTGRKAGASIDRYGDIVGPFVRFAVAVINPSDTYLPRAVLAALYPPKKIP